MKFGVAVAATAIVLLAGCNLHPDAAGTFHSSTPHQLTVATTSLPEPGFWTGPAERPDGGLEQGIADALAKRFRLSRIKVHQIPLAQLAAGDLDGADLALARLTPTSDRTSKLTFSGAYLTAPPAALTRKDTSISDPRAAQELRWAAVRGSTLAAYLDATIKPTPAVVLTAHETEAIAALTANEVDAILVDLPVALARAEASQGALRATAQFPGDETMAAALPKGSRNVEAVDTALRAFHADGTIRALTRRWLAADPKNVPLISIGS